MDPEADKISFRGRLTEKDWRRAMSLVRASQRTISPYLAGTFALLAGLLFVAVAIVNFWLLIPGGLLLYFAWSQLTGDRRSFRQMQSLEEISGSLSAAGFETNYLGATTQSRWNSVLRCLTSRNIVVLETAPQTFLLLPRHYFASDEAWKALQQLLQHRRSQPPHQPAPLHAAARRRGSSGLLLQGGRKNAALHRDFRRARHALFGLECS